MKPKNDFGITLTKIRKKYNLKMEDIATSFGCSKQFLHFVSTDQKAIPTTFKEKIENLNIEEKDKEALLNTLGKKIIFYSNNKKIIETFSNRTFNSFSEIKKEMS